MKCEMRIRFGNTHSSNERRDQSDLGFGTCDGLTETEKKCQVTAGTMSVSALTSAAGVKARKGSRLTVLEKEGYGHMLKHHSLDTFSLELFGSLNTFPSGCNLFLVLAFPGLQTVSVTKGVGG